MDAATRSYLKRIGVANELVGRIDAIRASVASLVPDQIKRVFVSEFTAPDGTRQYVSVWFFGNKFMSEAPGFVSPAQNMFDCVPLAKNFTRCEITWTNYDLRRATKDSQLNATFSALNAVSGALYASGLNCDHLRQVLKTFVLPNTIG